MLHGVVTGTVEAGDFGDYETVAYHVIRTVIRMRRYQGPGIEPMQPNHAVSPMGPTCS